MRTAVRAREDNRDAVSVGHGPLTRSLWTAEDRKRFAGTEEWPEYEVRPGLPWNADRFSRVAFAPVSTTALPLRVRLRLRADFPGGVPAWRAGPAGQGAAARDARTPPGAVTTPDETSTPQVHT